MLTPDISIGHESFDRRPSKASFAKLTQDEPPFKGRDTQQHLSAQSDAYGDLVGSRSTRPTNCLFLILHCTIYCASHNPTFEREADKMFGAVCPASHDRRHHPSLALSVRLHSPESIIGRSLSLPSSGCSRSHSTGRSFVVVSERLLRCRQSPRA